MFSHTNPIQSPCFPINSQRPTAPSPGPQHGHRDHARNLRGGVQEAVTSIWGQPQGLNLYIHAYIYIYNIYIYYIYMYDVGYMM